MSIDAVGECEETMITIWSAEVGGDMIANVDCKYAAVSKRHMPNDQKIELILLCKLEKDMGMRYGHIKQSSHKCGEMKKEMKKKKIHVTMKGIPYTSSNSSRFVNTVVR